MSSSKGILVQTTDAFEGRTGHKSGHLFSLGFCPRLYFLTKEWGSQVEFQVGKNPDKRFSEPSCRREIAIDSLLGRKKVTMSKAVFTNFWRGG